MKFVLLSSFIAFVLCATCCEGYKVTVNGEETDFSRRTELSYDCKKATFTFNGTQVTACQEANYTQSTLFGGSACTLSTTCVAFSLRSYVYSRLLRLADYVITSGRCADPIQSQEECEVAARGLSFTPASYNGGKAYEYDISRYSRTVTETASVSSIISRVSTRGCFVYDSKSAQNFLYFYPPKGEETYGQCLSYRPCFCRSPKITSQELNFMFIAGAVAVALLGMLFTCCMWYRARAMFTNTEKGVPKVWNTSHFTAMEEGIRQGEAETERRIRMMKIYQGRTGAVNPLIEHYKDDPEICRLQVDKEQLRGHLVNSFLHNPIFCIPCFWPHQMVLCAPCTLFCYTLGLMDKKADAHTVILCKNSIKYVVEPYPSIVQTTSTFELSFIPWCVACCCSFCVTDTMRIEEVFPLTDVTEAGLSECKQVACGAWVAPDTFYVKTKQDSAFSMAGHLNSIAVDAPMDVQAFIEEVNKQRKLAEPLPANVRELYDNCASIEFGNTPTSSPIKNSQHP